MKRITLLLALVALPSFASDQSLAEAARKARERREKNAKEGVKTKVYTQEDVQKAPPLRLVRPWAGESETAWRGRFAEARRRAESARKEYDFWNGYTMVPGEILVDEKDRPVITSIGQLQGKTAAAKRALEAAEKALGNLEEDARKAGVPPGWLR